MEEHYKTFVEFTDNLITQVNGEGVFTYINRASEKYYGIPPEECIGQSAFSFIDPRDKEATAQWFERCLKSKVLSDKIENRQVSKEGVVHEMRWNVNFQYESNGDLKFINSIATDITEEKRRDRIEAAGWRFLEFAKEHTVMELLRKFLDEAESLTNSKIGFFHFVEEDQMTLSLQTWSTNTLEKMCTAEGAGQHYPFSKAGIWVDCVKVKKPVIHNDYASLEHKKGLPQGHAPIIRELVVPVFRDEKIVAILGVGNKEALYADEDIRTVQQLADKAWETIVRKRAEEEVDKLRLYLEDVINSMPSILVGVDQNCCITELNSMAAKDMHISLEEAKGQALDTVIPRLKSICKKIKETIVAGREMKETLESIQKDGKVQREIVTVFPLSSKETKGAVIRLDDMTERMRFEVLLMNNEKMLSLGRLSAGIAHEINNPLAGIVHAVSNMSNRLGFNDKHPVDVENNIHDYLKGKRIPQMLDIIQEGCRRISHITGIMTDFKEKESDEISLCDISDIIEKSLSILKIETDLLTDLDFEQLHIISEIDEDARYVHCERSKMEQVVVNILRNAVQAVEEESSSSREIYIRSFKDPGGEFINLEVSDKGIGMKESVRKRIFEPFFTTREVGKGIGLGLSISYFIVTDLHKGHLSVYSKEGSGTKVLIQLPIHSSMGRI